MKPEKRERGRAHARAQNAKTHKDKGPRAGLEGFEASLPDVKPVKVTEAAVYYYAKPIGWWFEPACPIHPEAFGPFSSLEEAISIGERGCTPCRDMNCTARIKSSPEESSARTPSRAHVIDLKPKPSSHPLSRRSRDR